MSPQDLAALLRRHLAAVIGIFLLAAGVGYHFKHAKMYTDTATVAFVAPGRGTNVFSTTLGLLATDQVVATYMSSPAGERQVRIAGGAADYDVALVNLNNEEFPNYGVPDSTVMTTSPDPAEAQRTMSAVLGVLQKDLASRQAAQGAKPDAWIEVRPIAAPTGPIEQTGSAKRILAGLVVLTVIAAFMAATFLDRHPVRLRDLPRWRRRRRLDTADRGWPDMRVHPGAN